jgi:hypothetical protein
MSESTEQAAIVQWFRAQYPQYKRLLIPSQSGVIIGGKNKFAVIAKQKREGWIRGVPDLQLAIPKCGYHGLFIELKDVGKTEKAVIDEQKLYLKELSEAGYLSVWRAGADSAIDTIKRYMNNELENA